MSITDDATGARIRLDCHKAAVDFFAPLFSGMRKESLQIAHLDANQQLIGLCVHHSSLCDSVELPLRLILYAALRLESVGLVCAHNHPSGDAAPSESDLIATRTLASLLRPLGIRLYDHLIFGDDEAHSFRAMGLL